MFTASDVLLKAASRIEEEGMWCQGFFFKGVRVDDKPTALGLAESLIERLPECAMGALMGATVELGLGDMGYDQAEHLLSTLIFKEHSQWIAQWNDTPGRTAHEVAEAMRRAAL